MADAKESAHQFGAEDNSLLDDEDMPPNHPPPQTPVVPLGSPSFAVVGGDLDAPPAAAPALGSTTISVINSDVPAADLSDHFEAVMDMDVSRKRMLLLRRIVTVASVLLGGLTTSLFAIGFVLAITKSFPHPVLFVVGGFVAAVAVLAFLLNLVLILLPSARLEFYVLVAGVQVVSLISSILGSVLWGLIIDEDTRAVVVVMATVCQFLAAACGSFSSVYMIMYPAQTGADGQVDFTLLEDGTQLPPLMYTLPPLLNVLSVLFGVTAFLLMILFWPLAGSIHYTLMFSWSLCLILICGLVIILAFTLYSRRPVLNVLQLAISTVTGFIVSATAFVIVVLAIISSNAHILLMEFPLAATELTIFLAFTASGMRWIRDRSEMESSRRKSPP